MGKEEGRLVLCYYRPPRHVRRSALQERASSRRAIPGVGLAGQSPGADRRMGLGYSSPHPVSLLHFFCRHAESLCLSFQVCAAPYHPKQKCFTGSPCACLDQYRDSHEPTYGIY